MEIERVMAGRALLLILLTCGGHCDDFDFNKQTNKDHWVDPNDMINYDPVTKTMRNAPKPPIRESDAAPIKADPSDGKDRSEKNTESDGKSPPPSECDCKNIQILNDSLTQCRKQMERCPVLQEEPFFRQFIRSVRERFKNFATHGPEDGHYAVRIKMTPSEFCYLTEYGERQQGTIQEVHSILGRMMTDASWELANPDKHKWFNKELAVEYLTYASWMVCVLLGTAWYARHIMTCMTSRRWFLAFLIEWFLISVAWTWWRLYKKEISARNSTVMKKVPQYCMSNEKTYSEWFYSLFTVGSDECGQYFEKLEIDPFWTVTPTKALAVTLAEFFLAPAGQLGEAIKKLMVSSFDGLPFYLWLPVYGLLLLVIVLGLFVVSGYRLRTLLFSIEPHHPPPPAEYLTPVEGREPLRLQEVHQEQIKALRRDNEQLRMQLQSPRNLIRQTHNADRDRGDEIQERMLRLQQPRTDFEHEDAAGAPPPRAISDPKMSALSAPKVSALPASKVSAPPAPKVSVILDPSVTNIEVDDCRLPVQETEANETVSLDSDMPSNAGGRSQTAEDVRPETLGTQLESGFEIVSPDEAIANPRI